MSLPQKIIGLAQIFSCDCPKNLNFAQILETWGAIAPPAPPAGMAMYNKFFFDNTGQHTNFCHRYYIDFRVYQVRRFRK